MATPTLSSDAHADKEQPLQHVQQRLGEISVTLLLNAFMAVCLVAVAAFYGNLSSVYAPKPRRRTSAIRSGLRGFRERRSLDDEALGRAVGPDAQLLIRFLRCWPRHHDGGLPRGLPIILLIYPQATVLRPGRHRESGFYAWTIANVKKGAPRGWAAVVFMYFFTCYALRRADREARRYAKLRYDYLSQVEDDEDGPQARCSVFVERVPRDLRSDGALLNYFRRLARSENAVHSAVVFRDCRKLEKVRRRRDEAKKSARSQ